MFDCNLALMTGIDIPVPEIQMAIHQPTVKEISFMGEREFFIAAQCLCIQKSMFVQDKNLLSDVSNFQIFMTVMSEKETADKKASVMQLLSILFPKYKVLMSPRALVFNGEEKDSHMVDETNFEALQLIFGKIFCLANAGQEAYNPANDKAREIANKLMRGRQKVAEQRAAENGGGSMLAQYISTLTIGLGSMSLKDCLDLTIYQLYDLMERYGLYINWDIDLKSRLAGAKPDKPVENWMKNIHQ